MRRLRIALVLIALTFILTACMYSKTTIVESSPQISKDSSVNSLEADRVNTSAYLAEFIGVDSKDRLISLNKAENGCYISAAHISDTSLQRVIIRDENITDAALANHGNNIVYRTNDNLNISLYSYSIYTRETIKLYTESYYKVKSEFSVSNALSSVSDVIYKNAEYYIVEYDLVTGSVKEYCISDNGLKNSLEYIADDSVINCVFVDKDERATVKVTGKYGSYIISANMKNDPENLMVIEASSINPQYADGMLFYSNKQNELMALNFESKTEQRISKNVKDFTLSSDKKSIAYISTNDGADKLYMMNDMNSSTNLIDLRKGIDSISISADGEHMLISYVVDETNQEANAKEYLMYEIKYDY